MGRNKDTKYYKSNTFEMLFIKTESAGNNIFNKSMIKQYVSQFTVKTVHRNKFYYILVL